MDVVCVKWKISSARLLALSLVGLLPVTVLARGGWDDPPNGWEYVYEASSGQDQYVAGENVVGLLDGTWAQNTSRSYWDGTPPGVANTTNLDPDTGNLLPPAPGGVVVVCPEGQVGEDGNPLCYLVIEDVGNPTDGAVYTPPYIEPSKRKLYFYHQIGGTSENGWTLVARLRLSPQAIDSKVDMTNGFNGENVNDLPMVAVHDTDEGTVGFSINDAGKLVVLADGAANEIDIGSPTEWVTVWLSAVELPGTPEGRYNIKVFIDGSTTPALTLTAAQAPISEITGSPNYWIAIGSGHTADDAAFQIDYVAYKAGAFEPGQTILCPTGFVCNVERANGRIAVDLDWNIVGGETFDGFDLRRDGEILDTDLPGTTVEYIDTQPLPGIHTYELTARKGADSCVLTCQESMCLYDLACTFRPGTEAGKVDNVLIWNNPGGIDSIQVVRRLQHLDDLNEVDETLATLPGTDAQYVDRAIDAADLTRITYTLTATIGTVTCQIQCRPTTCPHDALCTVDRTGAQPQVLVQWTANRAFDSITVNRRTDPAGTYELKATLAGNAAEYRDPDVTVFGFYEYEILAAQSGQAEPCGGTGCRITVLPAEVPYKAPEGGWSYIYDAEAANSDRYNAVAGETGNLDGSWIRSTVEDHWDGSKPGDTANPPAGPAPGGISIVSLAAADPCKKESRKVLLMEDPGDPTQLGYPDPGSNRKFFIGFDLGRPTENLLRNGLTFSVRMRLTPVPVDIPVEPGNAAIDGDGLGKGLGMVGIYFRNPGTVETQTLGASASLAFSLDEGGAHMSLNPEYAVTGLHSEEFHTLWVTINDPEGDDTYAVSLYVNGSTTPIALTSPLQVPSPGSVASGDPGFGANVVNFLAIGCPNTGADASVQIDYIAWKDGVNPPVADSCGPPPAGGFRRGDVNVDGAVDLSDPVNVLGYLFLGSPKDLACFDAADADDSGELDITDAVYSLNWQFLGGKDILPPGPFNCGLDPTTADPLPACNYPQNLCQ